MGSGIAFGVFVTLFAFVTILGFLASRWRKGDLSQLHEWGLGGHRFGSRGFGLALGSFLFVGFESAVSLGQDHRHIRDLLGKWVRSAISPRQQLGRAVALTV